MWNSKIFPMHTVIALQGEFNTDAIKACNESAEGGAGGFVRQVYDDLQKCSVGCVLKLTTIPLQV